MNKLLIALSLLFLFAATKSRATDLNDVQLEQQMIGDAFGNDFLSQQMQNDVVEDYVKEKIQEKVDDAIFEMNQ